MDAAFFEKTAVIDRLIASIFLSGSASPADFSLWFVKAVQTKRELPRQNKETQKWFGRLFELQEQSKDPDELGDLPVSDKTVAKMSHLIYSLITHVSTADMMAHSSLSVTPAGGLQLSWRGGGDSLSFTVKEHETVVVIKQGEALPKRYAISEESIK